MSIKDEKIQSSKQISITVKKISEYQVQKRCVVLRFIQVKFPQGSSHELTMVKAPIPKSLLQAANNFKIKVTFSGGTGSKKSMNKSTMCMCFKDNTAKL